jgi:hypothetical protein
MKRIYTLYVFSLAGALGGLTGSLLHQRLLLDLLAGSLQPSTRYGYLAVLGCLVGVPMGFFPTFIEGRANYSLRGAIQAGLLGGLLGGLSGIIALPLAEWLHVYLGGGLPGRVTGWALLGTIIGCFIGIAESRVGGARPWRSVLGGVAGGAVAGALLELLLSDYVVGAPVRQAASAGGPPPPHSDSGIWALLLLGLFIAFFIALFVNLLSDARLEGQWGSKVHGHVYHLGKFRDPKQAVLGSDKTPNRIFIYIPDAQPFHAGVTLTPRGAVLRHLADSGVTRVNDSPVEEHLLSDGELVEVGSARLIYREGRK